MDEGSRFLIIVIALFFCFAFYFAIAETSFASVSKVRIKAACECGGKRAKKALRVLDDFDHAVTTILIGTNITHLGIASIVTVLVIRKWGPNLVSISTIITTIAVFFLSEMLPKSIAKRYCEFFSLLCAGSLLFFMKLFYPFSYVLTAIGHKASSMLGQEQEVTVTEEELYDIIEDMADGGMLGEEQSELISSALEFGDHTVGGIMTKRKDVKMLSADTSSHDAKEFLLANKNSRYPVYDGGKDNIIGTLRMQKFLKAYIENKDISLRELVDPPFFIHPEESVSELLTKLNKQKTSMAIVVDGKNRLYGVTTTEDAINALVGSVFGGDKR